MEASRHLKVRLDTMSTKHFLALYALGAAMLGTSLGVGSAGPRINNSSTAAAGVDIFRSPTQTCSHSYTGAFLPAPIPHCWDWTFLFNSRFTQFFELQMEPRLAAGFESGSATLALAVTWWGRPTSSRDGTLLGGGYELIANTTIRRQLSCSGGTCDPIVVLRTSSIPYSRYFIQIVSATPTSDIPFLQSVDMPYRFRNPDFSMFEMGFKYTWFSIALLLTVAYIGVNTCNWPCCGSIEWLCLCCRRGALTFQRQEGINWLYAMLVGLVLFNEPLLGLTYYAPAPIIKLVSVAMQLAFISLLLAYWLVEFGFLKSNPQNASSISCCRFYAPKISAIFIYWLMAVAVYGYVLFKMQNEPLYDWVAEASANTFLRVWGGVIAGVYVLYLGWLVIRALTVIKSWGRGERYLFALHISVFVATALGLAGGYIYGVELVDALSFMFYNALFNMYIPVLTYLYTPVLYEALDQNEPAAEASRANVPQEAIWHGSIHDSSATHADDVDVEQASGAGAHRGVDKGQDGSADEDGMEESRITASQDADKFEIGEDDEESRHEDGDSSRRSHAAASLATAAPLAGSVPVSSRSAPQSTAIDAAVDDAAVVEPENAVEVHASAPPVSDEA